MKKILALVLATVLLIGLLASCNPREKVTLIILEDYFAEEQYGVGFRKEDIALGLEVQKILDEMYADGKLVELSTKWFGKDTYLKDASFIKETEALEGDESLQKVLDAGKLIMGLDDSFPPMGYRDENNKIVGYDIDLATEVAKRMGVELVLQPIDWDTKEVELKGYQIDCIWNGMTINPGRIEEMFFAKPYIENKQIIIVSAKSTVKSRADLEGKEIGLQKGSSAVDAVKEDAVYDKLKKIHEYQNNVDAFNDLKIGRIEALVVDEVAGRYLVSKDSGK